MIHDRCSFFKDEILTPFRVPIIDHLFVGQVHQIEPDGADKLEYDKD